MSKDTEELNNQIIDEATTKNGNDLIQAIKSSNFDKVKEIIDQSPDIAKTLSIQTENGETAIHWAIKNKKTAEEIITKAPKEALGIQDNEGNTALHIAISRGETELAEKIIEKAPEALTKKNNEGKTSLHLAIMKGNTPKTIRISIERDITKLANTIIETAPKEALNIQDNDGNTALHLAIKEFRTELAEKILQKAPELVSIPNNKGETPLYLAINIWYTGLANTIIETTPKEALNIQDNEGNTALHLAVIKGENQLAAKILQKAPELASIKNTLGKTPLHLAIDGWYTQSLAEQIIDKAPAALPVQDDNGNTALHLAITNGNTRLAAKILKKDPMLSGIKNKLGNTPLYLNIALEIAIINGDTRLAAGILQKAPKLATIKNEQDKTPLHLAVQLASEETPELIKIITKKIEANRKETRDADLESSRIRTLRKAFRDLVEKIVGVKGVDINALDKEGKTPLDYAKDDQTKLILKKAGAKTSVELESEAKKTTQGIPQHVEEEAKEIAQGFTGGILNTVKAVGTAIRKVQEKGRKAEGTMDR